MASSQTLPTINETYRQHELDPPKIPAHIAIIMDGNGRWAKKRLMPRSLGHRQGSESLRTTIKACVEFGVGILTVYTFSTENWSRPTDEVDFLIRLFKELIVKEIPELNRQGVRVRCLGDLSAYKPDMLAAIRKGEDETNDNNRLQLNLMLNYGARNEIVTAVNRLLASDIKQVNEETFSKYLYTANIPDPDILIRSGGDTRVSNYLLWQIAYSELIFTHKMWPEFNRKSFIDVIREYQSRQRRFGGV
ncbi:MAG: di-trans,poly-cis-decaprenylcistransferase [Candidatus Margulisbacteria bacterium]|nr:di-trans,poly-cis-decaprenylcistransferase [Candidatus Margulisiibacteriota bacterium]